MGHHRMPCNRKPLNHTFGVGLVAGTLTLSGAGLLLPATANADVQESGQSDSPGAAGGNHTVVNFSNNTYVVGDDNVTGVNQTNQNTVGGNGNVGNGRQVIRIPDVEVGYQNNSPGAAGSRTTLLRVSNNVIVVGRGNTNAVNQDNENDTGGNGNSSNGSGSTGAMRFSGQHASPGAAGGNTTDVDISNNTWVVGRNNSTTINQFNQNTIGGSNNTVTPAGGGDSSQIGGQNNSPGAAGGNTTGIRFSNNTFVAGEGNTTQVNQFNQNTIAGDNNSVAPGGGTGSPMQWGGQNNSPGAAGGNQIGASVSNNTFVVGRNNTTQVTQFNQNTIAGSGNTVGPAAGAPNNPLIAPLQIAGQNNSPGAAGGDIIGLNASNNTWVVGEGNRTQVVQVNQNYFGGDDNAVNFLPFVVTGVPEWWIPMQFGGQKRSPGAAGGNIGGGIANNTFEFGGGNITEVTQENLNIEGGSNNSVVPVGIPLPLQP